MPKDKYSAVWLSHSSIRDFLNCPRAYYLSNIYKNPKSNRKLSLMKPPLALGHAVHTVIDQISSLPIEKRFEIPLKNRYEAVWQTVSGKRGGFLSSEEEDKYKQRGLKMIERIEHHPGPLLQKAVKIGPDLPYYWLSEEDNLILCGKIDWIVYEESTDSIQIIDFKTGRLEEKNDSLQLPIYYLLALHCQKRPVTGASFWYLDRDNKPIAASLPSEIDAKTRIMTIASRVILARKLEHFKCIKDEKNGCSYCAPLQAIIDGQGEFVGIGEYREEIYILPDNKTSL